MIKFKEIITFKIYKNSKDIRIVKVEGKTWTTLGLNYVRDGLCFEPAQDRVVYMRILELGTGWLDLTTNSTPADAQARFVGLYTPLTYSRSIDTVQLLEGDGGVYSEVAVSVYIPANYYCEVTWDVILSS